MWSNQASATLISIGVQQAGINGGAITTVATDTGSGSATFAGLYGTFNLNLSAQGAPSQTAGTLNTAVLATSAVGGTISVYFTETGLSAPTAGVSFLSAFASTLFPGAAVSDVETTYFSATNALYGGTQLSSATWTGTGTSTDSNTATLPGTYSETVKYTLASNAFLLTPINQSVNLSAVATPAAVPEPASLLLVIGSLAGLAFVRRRAV